MLTPIPAGIPAKGQSLSNKKHITFRQYNLWTTKLLQYHISFFFFLWNKNIFQIFTSPLNTNMISQLIMLVQPYKACKFAEQSDPRFFFFFLAECISFLKIWKQSGNYFHTALAHAKNIVIFQCHAWTSLEISIWYYIL